MIDYHVRKILEAMESDKPREMKQVAIECQLREYAVQLLLGMIEKQQEEIRQDIQEDLKKVK